MRLGVLLLSFVGALIAASAQEPGETHVIAENIAALNARTALGPFKLGEKAATYSQYNATPLKQTRFQRANRPAVIEDNSLIELKPGTLSYGNMAVNKVKLGVISGVVVDITLVMDTVALDDL